MSKGTPAITLDASNPVTERKDVCHQCHAVITLVYPAKSGWLSAYVAPNVLAAIRGYGPFEVDVTNTTNDIQTVNITILQPDHELRPVDGGLILRLGFADKLETVVFCSWSCAQAGVQPWVQGIAAKLVEQALMG